MKKKHYYLLAGLIVFLLVGIVVLIKLYPNAEKGRYVAVFLDNNQVYFGQKLNVKNNFLQLEKVFYLTDRQALIDAKNQAKGGDLVLSKLSKDAHQPQDGISINQDHIVLIEVLTDNSRVKQIIEKYQDQE